MSVSPWAFPFWINSIVSRPIPITRGVPAGIFPHAGGVEADVVWNVCSEKLQCANISVPLDYRITSDGRTIMVAVNRVEATDKANSKGAVFFNPGGPGGSGTSFVESLGTLLSAFLEGQYDIVGFDPRGVYHTKPYVSCFDSLLQEAAFLKAYSFALNLPASASALNSSDVKADLTRQIAYFNASMFSLSQECHKCTGEAISYVGNRTYRE